MLAYCLEMSLNSSNHPIVCYYHIAVIQRVLVKKDTISKQNKKHPHPAKCKGVTAPLRLGAANVV